MPALIVLIIVAIAYIILRIITHQNYDNFPRSAQKKAGDEGEMIARNVIRQELRDGDLFFNNVSIRHGDDKAECDNIVVNKYGVFVIEVKNYAGALFGEEDDYKWVEEKISPRGERTIKEVKNPIRQAKRQAGILANILRDNGVHIWVEAYALFIENNCPIKSDMVLESPYQISTAIHTTKNQLLSQKEIDIIKNILK